jgi:hypothetical protein
MYCVERLNKVLQGYAQNMAQLEASGGMGYLMDETLGLITEYIQQFQLVNSQIWDFDEKEGIIEEVLEGATI